jgi:mono/diheme cytochrome c family protein
MMTQRSRLVATTVVATLAALAALGLGTGALVLYGGYYDVGSTRQHLQPVHTLLELGMRESVRHHASALPIPDAVIRTPAAIAVPTPALLRGAALYRDNCVVCHGAPGVAQGDIGKSMQPVPGPLADAVRRWRPNELYWITRHGIKMSGMPAWEFRLADDDLWAVVGLLVALPHLTPQAYAALSENAGRQQRAALPDRGVPDATRGHTALTQYACQACHIIPGVTGPNTYVGPPLKGLATRKYIAGGLPNNAANLAQWIREPHRIDPLTAMPDMSVTASDARDMAAYLLSR